MDDSIGQLLTLGVIFGAWIVKGVLEAKKRKDRAAQRPHPKPRPPQDPALELDLRRQRAPVPSPMPPPMPAPRAHAAPHLGARHPGTLQVTHGTAAPDTHETVVRSARTRERRARTLRILAPDLRTGDARALTRAGVLWSEVLGPPRAYRGPHRPPSAGRPY